MFFLKIIPNNFPLAIFLFLIPIFSFSQKNIIKGKVVNKNNVPIQGVEVCQLTTNNCCSTDNKGFFRLKIKKTKKIKLSFWRIGYETKYVSISDTIKTPIIIQMYSPHNINPEDIVIRYNHPVVPILHFQINYNPVDFSNFENIFGKSNIELMNKLKGNITAGIGINTSKHYVLAEYGWLGISNTYHDSISAFFFSSQYSLSYGYSIINTRRILLIPKTSFQWTRYRLINSPSKYKILIQQFNQNQYLDIRFNQLTSSTGIDLSYKTYDRYGFSTIGIYLGYVFNINKYPFIYTINNKLVNNSEIIVSSYCIGFSCIMNFGL